MSYLELKIVADSDFAEIMMAELGEIGFETFTEEPDALFAYISANLFDEDAFNNLIFKYRPAFSFSYESKIIEKQNWNAEWEKNYPPIYVAGKVMVRASFHEHDPSFIYDIVINPKMSFGTGHHETTTMVMEHMLEMGNFNEKSVMDVGCGTGILAILAEKLGAKELSAFDIEEWAAENAKENVVLNNCKNIEVRQGTIENEPKKLYDILLANINRNILLQDVNQYVRFMKASAQIIISGFYQSDKTEIEAKFSELGLVKTHEKQKNNWASLRFRLV